MKDEIILTGYDARIASDCHRYLWPLERKQRYFPRESCLRALSVDFLVWPSIFDNKSIGVGLSKSHKEELGMGSLPMPSWVGPNHPFWEDIGDLIRHAEAYARDWELIKVEKFVQREIVQTVDASVNENGEVSWIFCGFDVADDGFTSSITDLYSPLIVHDAKKNMGRLVNDNALFVSIDDAIDWIAYIKTTLPEMPPQSIYKLYIAKQSEKRKN